MGTANPPAPKNRLSPPAHLYIFFRLQLSQTRCVIPSSAAASAVTLSPALSLSVGSSSVLVFCTSYFTLHTGQVTEMVSALLTTAASSPFSVVGTAWGPSFELGVFVTGAPAFLSFLVSSFSGFSVLGSLCVWVCEYSWIGFGDDLPPDPPSDIVSKDSSISTASGWVIR